MLCEDAPWPHADDHVTKSRNRKLIRVTSSTESQNHKCVDLSDHSIHLNQIWYRAQILHYEHTRMAKFTWPENTRWRPPRCWFLGYVKSKMSVTPDWIRYLHQILRDNALATGLTACTKVQVVITACMVAHAVVTVWTVAQTVNDVLQFLWE